MSKLIAIEDKNEPGDFRVEHFGDDGECYVTIFTASDAEKRAKEYAGWLSTKQTNRQPERCECGTVLRPLETVPPGRSSAMLCDNPRCRKHKIVALKKF